MSSSSSSPGQRNLLFHLRQFLVAGFRLFGFACVEDLHARGKQRRVRFLELVDVAFGFRKVAQDVVDRDESLFPPLFGQRGDGGMFLVDGSRSSIGSDGRGDARRHSCRRACPPAKRDRRFPRIVRGFAARQCLPFRRCLATAGFQRVALDRRFADLEFLDFLAGERDFPACFPLATILHQHTTEN